MKICRLLLPLMLFGICGAGPSAWDGESSPERGKGWSDPATSRVAATHEAAHQGQSCLRIDLKGPRWKGIGWNWFGWYPPDSATDARGMSDLVFWLKASRPNAALQVRLVDNHKGSTELVDLAAAHVLPTLPVRWQLVRVPLAVLGGNIDLARLWEIHFATSSPGDLVLWLDEIGFDRTGDGLASDASKIVRVTVDTRTPSHAISPYIYGASAVDAAQARELGLTTVRWGGNPSSRYNWRARAENAGSDWFFLNRKAGRWSDFDAANTKNGLVSYLTVPMLPWVAKGPDGWGFSVAKYGHQRRAESYVADRGDGIRPDGKPITGNDPRDTSVPSDARFQAEGLRTLPRDPTGPPCVYGLDNEPMLWHETHRDVHPEPVSYDEALRLGREFARAIKHVDPRGLVAGPCTWGWTDLNYSAADAGTDRYRTHADRKAHGDQPFLPWYLAGMRAASAESGRRLLDLVDVHFYPQGQADGQMVYGSRSHSDAMRALRLRSTRGLWDPNYRDESWINEPVQLIPRVRRWVGANNPGIALCIGEYSWGGDDDPSGAVAQAEILGIFARERVDYAYYWAGLAGVQRFAFQLYRNPDGHHRGLGERYLTTLSDSPDRISAFAARREDGALTIVLVNKDLSRSADVLLALGSTTPISGQVFRMPNPPGPILREELKGASRNVTVPALSAALVVLQ